MPPSTIHAAPPLDSFTPLADHQAQTPTSFFGAKPVLHYHAAATRALAARSQLSKLPIFAPVAEGQVDEEEAGANSVEVVEAFVNSENLTFFNPATSSGVSIPYQAISLHAIQTLDDPSNSTQQVQGLYMQLELSDPYAVNEDDEDADIVELTLIPPPSTTEGGKSSIQVLFEAVSNCSNLHPDPSFEEDEEMADGGADSRIVFEGSVGYEGISGLPGVQAGAANGGLPPPFPGSGGWITAENVSEYFDEDGNWIGEGNGPTETLGEGAGRIRTRDEVDGSNGVNGQGVESDENKRPRTE
ncbi:hypothetical protein LSUE1_G008252 [Lachnellula suecica]|uniref:Protein LOT5 n=1 Tax=Lachnellula suecica TaxID=602035 RepID=A0A8T9BZ05_9HELO|nr:hypothetical protein LSUE1_G008252 [Lachnellula suecica]